MIGNSLSEYIFIRASITALRLIAPLSIIHLIIYPLKGGVRWLTIPAIAEASFYLLIYLPRRRRLQAPPTHPPHPLTQAQRRAIFAKCLASSPVHPSSSAPYPTGWFLPQNSVPKREDVVDWLLWALFSSTREEVLMEEWRDELDGYLAEVEGLLGRKLEDGHGVKSMRLTLDPVVMLHRPLLWYLIVGIVDVYTSIILFSLGFRHYSPAAWFQCFPPRPLLSLFSRRAHKGVPIPYWYRPHRSTTKLPIVFLHGIGIGLYPYIPFIRALLSPSFTSDSDVGILLPELLPISFHMTPRAVPPRPEMLMSLNIILESLHEEEQRDVVRPLEGIEDATTIPTPNPSGGWSKVVLAAHSYGTFVAGWIVRDCVDPISNTKSSPSTTPPIYTEQDPLLPMSTTSAVSPLSSKIAHLVLVDPIPILLSHPAVAHNFVYRHPSTTSCRPLPEGSTLSPSSGSTPFAGRDRSLKSLFCPTLTFKYPLTYSAASAWQLWYFASRDADVARTLSRAFFWEEGGIWKEEILEFISGRGLEQVDSQQPQRGIIKPQPEQGGIIKPKRRRRNVAVVLAGRDQIVPAEAVRRYLTGEEEPCTKWVSGEQEEHGDQGEEEGGGEGRVSEVLFNPRLDHANVFETEENTGDLMDVLWRYVRCV